MTFWSFWKASLFKENHLWLIFRQQMEHFGLLFISTIYVTLSTSKSRRWRSSKWSRSLIETSSSMHASIESEILLNHLGTHFTSGCGSDVEGAATYLPTCLPAYLGIIQNQISQFQYLNRYKHWCHLFSSMNGHLLNLLNSNFYLCNYWKIKHYFKNWKKLKLSDVTYINKIKC